MKTISKISFALILVFICTNSLFAQTEENEEKVQETKYPETMIVKFIESHNTGVSNNSKIITIKSDDSVEIQDLEKGNVAWNQTEGLSANLIKLRQELQKWHNYGFTIKSSSATSYGASTSITTIYLEKN